MIKLVRKFFGDIRGGTLTVMGVLAVPLMMVTGFSADYFILYQQRSALQNAADAGALASARELILTGAKEDTIKSVARNYVNSVFSHEDMISGGDAKLNIDTVVDKNDGKVTVELSYTWSPFMAQHFSNKVTPIVVRSSAGITGSSSICKLSLDQDKDNSLYLSKGAMVTANDCAVQANSDSSSAIYVGNSARLNSEAVCSSGGYKGGPLSYSTTPITDCPPLPDPLKGRVFKEEQKCDFHQTVVSGKKKRLKPGTYCGGIFVTDRSTVTFAP